MSTATCVSLLYFPKFCFIGPTTLNLTMGGIFKNWISSSFHVFLRADICFSYANICKGLFLFCT